jgi:hypothetical protein
MGCGMICQKHSHGGEPPVLAQMPGFNLTRVFPDSMHTVDMGVTPFVVGSVLWEVVANGTCYPGASRDKKLEAAFVAYKKFNKERGILINSSVWSVVKLNKKKASSFAFMKSKANECKKIVPFLLHLVTTNDSGSEHDMLRRTVVWALFSYYTDIADPSRYFTGRKLGTLQFHVGTFLSCYNALNVEAQASGIKNWHAVPKFHMMEHIADSVAPQAPRFPMCGGAPIPKFICTGPVSSLILKVYVNVDAKAKMLKNKSMQ